jgi:hypothetical protein
MPPQKSPRPEAGLFRDWLLSETGPT